MKLQVYDPYKQNSTVTKEYVLTIAKAFEKAGYEIEYIDKLVKQKKQNKNIVLVIAVKDAITAKLLRYKSVCLWVQGIVPEESYMAHQSRLKYFVWSKIEKCGLRSSDFVFYVSEAMRQHLSKKYNYNNENYYIMPCFNSEFDSSSFMAEDKYNKNLFLYAGGLAPWQCFEQTIKLYSHVEKFVSNAELRVLTKNREMAEEIIKKYNVKNYSIDFKSTDEIKSDMKQAKFGFSLREESPVNYVSTPTKLSTYVSHGVIPIYSKNIADFSAIAEGKKYTIRADDDNGYGIDKIVELCEKEIAAQDVYMEFQKTFGDYYSREYHINRMIMALKKEFE